MSLAAILGWILGGLGVTFEVTAASFMIAAPFALLFGVLAYRCTGLARLPVIAIIEFWRSSSVIVLLFAFFYILPGAGVFLPPLMVGSLVLGCSAGSYGAQAVRAALLAVPRGQLEAARSLGLSRNRTLRLVAFPQALRLILPVFGNEIVELIKTTATVSLITMSDMTSRAKEVLQLTYRPGEVYGSLLLVYVVLCGAAALLVGWALRRMVWTRAA